MGIFCMVFGVIVFLGFAGAGALVADSLINAQFSVYATGSLADFATCPRNRCRTSSFSALSAS